MRPLYIDGTDGTFIKLDDPALKVSCPDVADQLFPLQRISRVVVTGDVRWEIGALLACADQGISVTFLGDQGELRARWLGKCGERQAFMQRLADLMARSDGLERYGDWLGAMERMVVKSAARGLLKNQQESVTRHQLQAFFNYQRQFLPVQPVDTVYNTLRGLLAAQLVQLFQDAGLGAASELLQDGWLDLQDDFAGLLFWDLEVPLLGWLETLAAAPTQQELVVFYDSRSARITHLYQGLVNKLHCWLVELY